MTDNPFSSPPEDPRPPQAPPAQEAASPLDAIVPTNPIAAVSCYAGIFSMLFCIIGILLGPLAIITGMIGLKKGSINESQYGKTTSKIRAWIGIVTGTLGTILSIVVIVMIFLQA